MGEMMVGWIDRRIVRGEKRVRLGGWRAGGVEERLFGRYNGLSVHSLYTSTRDSNPILASR